MIRTCWAALGFVALSLAVNAALLPGLATTLPGNAGDPMLNAWILGWVSDAALAHPWDVWDAPIFHPHQNTLAYSEHLLGVALFVAPVYWATGNPILTYNVAFLAGYAFAGFAMFVLVRRLTGRTDAAVVAGVAFACSPYLVASQVARLQMLTCGWSVLALAALHAFLDASRWRALAGFVAAWLLQMLSNMYLGVFLALPVAVVLLHALIWRRPRLLLSQATRLAAGGLVLLLVMAPVLAVYSRVQDDMGFGHGTAQVRNYSADVRSYLSVWHEREPRLLHPELSADRALYPGAAVLVLALAGAVFAGRHDGRVRRDLVWLYVAIAAAAFLFSLGPEPAAWGRPLGIPSPYGALRDAFPDMDGFRAPARFALPVLVALAALSGWGVAALAGGLPPPVRRGAIVLAVAVALFEARRPYDWLAILEAEEPSTTAAYTWLARQPYGPVLKLPITTHFQAQSTYAGGSVTLRYQLAALRHRKPLINGSSGFVSPLVTLLQGPASPLNTLDTVDDALRISRAIGGRYVVVHRHEYREHIRDHVARVLDHMRADTAQVSDVREFGSTVVLTLTPAPPALPPEPTEVLGPEHYQVSVSHDVERVAHLVDGDRTSRWAGPQEGDTWLEIQLRRARLVSGVKLLLPAYAIGEYPHQLRVIGTTPAGADVVLFDDTAVTATAFTALFEPAEPGVRIVWTPTTVSRLRLEQRGSVGDRRWSVFELQLLAPADDDGA